MEGIDAGHDVTGRFSYAVGLPSCAPKNSRAETNDAPVRCLQVKFQLLLFKFVTNQKFEIAIMCIIGVNMVGMAAEYHGQPDAVTSTLAYVNLVFVSIFILECVVKLLALRWYYFKEPWNIFDFVVVLISIAGQSIDRLSAAATLHAQGTLNSREWKTQEWKSWHHNAGVEIAGVEFSAPNIKAGKRGSGNLGRRKSMESEAIIIADCID